MKKRYADKNKVLLVNITRLGDMLQATPTIAGMKLENPDCHITVLVEKQFQDICHVLPHIDEVVGIDLAYTCRSLAREQTGIIEAYEYVTALVDNLKKQNFDYTLNMSSSAYTALLLRLLGISRAGGWTADEEGYRVIESEWARLFATSVHHQNRQYNSLNLVDIFRCSADVEEHPRQLLVKIEPTAKAHCETLISNAGFTNTGPLIAVQAGASQAKRQWSPDKFAEMISILDREYNARIILTGTPKESSIVDPIVQACNSKNVFSVVGKTSVAQLAALLNLCDVLVTGDTGPMHISVAAGTPVVAMFLASAYGFETGPYSEGNIVIQPVIGCGPCNPNKACSKPDCHENISPRLMAYLAVERATRDIREVPSHLAPPASMVVYRSSFDSMGFCDLVPINNKMGDSFTRHRKAYRKLWLDELGGFQIDRECEEEGSYKPLQVLDASLEGLADIVRCARRGEQLMGTLKGLIADVRAPAARLSDVNGEITELDRQIEQIGYHQGHLGPLTKMFVFAKENLQGSDVMLLASQMDVIYRDLLRRADKFQMYYRNS